MSELYRVDAGRELELYITVDANQRSFTQRLIDVFITESSSAVEKRLDSMDIGQFKQLLSVIRDILTALDDDSYSLEVDDRCLSECLIASLLIKSERGSDDSDIRALHHSSGGKTSKRVCHRWS
jgi:hypothetical protein